MNQDPLPPDLNWPRWRWLSAQWLGISGLIISSIAFFVQGPDQPLRIRIFITVAVLVLVTLLLPALVWLWGVATVTYKRVRSYPLLLQHAQRDATKLARAEEALNQAEKWIFSLVAIGRKFELAKARYDREKLYIVLKVREDLELFKGDILAVIHTDDQRRMGWFTVTEERGDGYYAVGTDSVDPLWMGDMRERGEVTVLPYMFAILVRRKEQ